MLFYLRFDIILYAMEKIRHATHDDVPPLIDDGCHTLILGSMLSPKSAEEGFYYAHPQNRFWRVLSAVFGVPTPISIEDKKRLCLEKGIALFDVIKSCDMINASDSTIKNVEFNDIKGLIERYNVTRVFATGGKAFSLLLKYNKTTNDPIIASAVRLPSTSPLNCAAKLDDLIKAYSVIKK